MAQGNSDIGHEDNWRFYDFSSPTILGLVPQEGEADIESFDGSPFNFEICQMLPKAKNMNFAITVTPDFRAVAARTISVSNGTLCTVPILTKTLRARPDVFQYEREMMKVMVGSLNKVGRKAMTTRMPMNERFGRVFRLAFKVIEHGNGTLSFIHIAGFVLFVPRYFVDIENLSLPFFRDKAGNENSTK